MSRKIQSNPRNYYRTGVTASDFRRVMEGNGWLSLTQLTAMFSDIISPEAKARYAKLCATTHGQGARHSTLPIEVRIATGCRDLMRSKVCQLVVEGKVQRDGKGKDSKYRWIETQDAAVEQTPS